MSVSRANNFDLIRLIAAIQVVIWHTQNHLKLTFLPKYFIDFMKYFPGVVVFFVISGFLIYASFDRNKNIIQYYKNRLLRIFPALWVAFYISMFIIYMNGYFTNLSLTEAAQWLFSQLTLFQGQTPNVLRAYALNDPNPSLWTIPVEFSFYVFIPVLFWMANKFKINRTKAILFFIVVSYGFNYYLCDLREYDVNLFQAFNRNLFPYLFYFLTGSLMYIHWAKIKHWYEGKGVLWLSIYVVYFMVMAVWLKLYEQIYWLNGFGLIGMLLLAQATISLAFTKPGISSKLLNGNDISYGLYLYHMIFVNLFFELGYKTQNISFLYVFVATFIFAILSWKLIEKPSLAMKNTSFKLLLFR